MAKVRVETPGELPQTLEVRDGMTIGRLSKCEIPVKSTAVSREHARIFIDEGRFYIEDLGSSNGTYLIHNGKKHLKIDKKGIDDGDVIQVGDTMLFFEDKTPDPLIGKNIAEHEVLERIGHGGMGIVYKARQVSMDRVVAIKLLSKKLTSRPAFVETFRNEAKIAGQFNHPNIIRVHDFGEFNGIYWYTMEFVEGDDLGDFLRRQKKMSVKKGLEVVLGVAKALEHAWKQKVIHRDIKPHNIILDKQGNVRLADLGLAQIIEQQPDSGGGNNKIMGTPLYMSPEQANGEDLDIRTDIYALGATFFHLVTGKLPFDSPNDRSATLRHTSEKRPQLRDHIADIPASIQTFFERIMAIKREQRPDDPAILVNETKDLLNRESTWLFEQDARAEAPSESLPVTAAPANDQQEPEPGPRSYGKYYVVSILAALAAMALVLFSTFQKQVAIKANAPTPTPTATATPLDIPKPLNELTIPEPQKEALVNEAFEEKFLPADWQKDRDRWNNFRVIYGKWHVSSEQHDLEMTDAVSGSIIPRIELRRGVYQAEGLTASVQITIIASKEGAGYAGLDLQAPDGQNIGVRVGEKQISLQYIQADGTPVQKILPEKVTFPVVLGFEVKEGTLRAFRDGKPVEDLLIPKIADFAGLINLRASSGKVFFDDLKISSGRDGGAKSANDAPADAGKEKKSDE